MSVLIQVVGGIVVVALIIRGAIGFWSDYRSRR
jgi:hypothetical protein